MKQDAEALLSPPGATPGRGGGRFALVAGLLALTFAWVVGWYWGTAAEIAGIWWRSDTFAHGLAVLPLFAWLVWRKRAALAGLAPHPAAAMLPVLALGGLGWLAGETVSAAVLSHFSLALVLVAGFVTVCGWRIARVLLFPLLFLFFGVPAGEFLLPVLMRHTADFTVFALRATGVPVYQEGLHFVIPNGRWSVVEACSGLRYLVASLMVGALYAYLNYVSLKRRLLFMLVALLVPIVANWLRAYITVRIGYHFGSEFVAGFIHIVYGWVFFGIVIVLMFWIGSGWREEAPTPAAGVVEAGQVSSRRGWVVAVAAALAALFPLLAGTLQGEVEGRAATLQAPPELGDWVLVTDGAFDYRPSFKGQRGELLQFYRRGDGVEVGLYAAFFADQRKGEELVMHGNTLEGIEAGGWHRGRLSGETLPVGKVRKSVLIRGGERLTQWGWYWVNGRVGDNGYVTKALLAFDRLAGRRDDSAAVLVLVPAASPEADAAARDFIGTYGDDIDAMLRKAGEGR
ncbi:exosortase A [Pseudothauera rhizosphaerae]|uniref:Exosortase A n=1 Tax=Pseudothauera rhizosphaerae TaxID=2565932 RepID=A0A4S4AR05_9RHOO|nr:exosortase A [Pseudothauera rhizosphaerae]THF61632.1 exosortase A [Pseudothauera rhizosphaerae]